VKLEPAEDAICLGRLEDLLWLDSGCIDAKRMEPMRSAQPIVRLFRVAVLGIVIAGASAADVGRPAYAEYAPASSSESTAPQATARVVRRMAQAKASRSMPDRSEKWSARPRQAAYPVRNRAPAQRSRTPIYLTHCALLR
jgi:hypothetical protein